MIEQQQSSGITNLVVSSKQFGESHFTHVANSAIRPWTMPKSFHGATAGATVIVEDQSSIITNAVDVAREVGYKLCDILKNGPTVISRKLRLVGYSGGSCSNAIRQGAGKIKSSKIFCRGIFSTRLAPCSDELPLILSLLLSLFEGKEEPELELAPDIACIR
jgi:hypothetical protein